MTYILFMGTALMLLLAGTIVYMVISVSGFKRYAQQRDMYYNERINGLEKIIQTELKNLLQTLKK